jgi:flavin reductase (DIM6/NTAB) family NADH-FMN oxidoreductase RutF
MALPGMPGNPGYRGPAMATQPTRVGPFPEGVDTDVYDRMRRRVLWRLPMGLYLLGTVASGRRNLMTINWAMQVSIQPKHVAVSVETSAVTHGLLMDGRCFSLSILKRDDRAEVRKFVKPAVDDPAARTLSGMPYRLGKTGAPIPEIAIAWLECEVREAVGAGSHTLFVGEVVDVGSDPAEEDSLVLRMEDTRMSYGG